MSSSSNSVSPITKIDPFQAAQTLGNLLSQTSEYKAFIEAQKALNTDPTSYKLSVEMRGHQSAIQCGRDLSGEHTAELTRLELEIEDLPVVNEYHQCAKELSALFHAVDRLVSQEAGVDFAINARRGGCACGG